jgi:hypothetical protein
MKVNDLYDTTAYAPNRQVTFCNSNAEVWHGLRARAAKIPFSWHNKRMGTARVVLDENITTRSPGRGTYFMSYVAQACLVLVIQVGFLLPRTLLGTARVRPALFA